MDTNRWHAGIVECRLDGVTSLTATVDRVSAEVLAATAGLPLERTTLRVDLVGSGAAQPRGRPLRLRERGPGRHRRRRLRIRDLTAPATDLEALAEEGTTRGAFVRVALAALAAAESAEEKSVVSDALRYGLEAFAGSEVGLR